MQPPHILTSKEILQDVVRLNTASIEQLKSDLELLLEQRKKGIQEKRERRLVETIYQYTETETYDRYKVLSEKLRLETITETEHKELLKLTPIIEANSTERLEHLMTLAKIRKISLREVMIELGLIVNEESESENG
jgi:hypothetical protein